MQIRFAALAALALATVAAPAQAQDRRDFTLFNNTGEPIVSVFVSPVRTDDWEEDVLSADILPTDEKLNIFFEDDVDACVYDLKIVHKDGGSAVWKELDLCRTRYVSVGYDEYGTPIAEYE